MNVRLIAGVAGLALLPALATAAEPATATANTTATAPAASDNQLLLGGGIGVASRYSGSRDTAVLPVVLLDYSHASGFFASTMRGLGYGAQAGPVTWSAALGYRSQRKEKDESSPFGSSGSDKLKGMGDVKGNATALFNLGYKPLSMLELSVAGEMPLSERRNGKTIHAGVTAQLLNAQNDDVSLGLTGGFADKDYMQTYYGVTAAQARTSKFAAYQPKAGLYETNLTLTWQHRLGGKWSVTSMVGAAHQIGDAGKSPLVERKTRPTGAVYIGYAY
jgi:outer membrane scaffolding protein for murein synthesis (MipA/OmpV family)